MESVEVDFCRECGMEFPDGREVFCPLCGLGVCLECGQGGLSEGEDEECPSCGKDLLLRDARSSPNFGSEISREETPEFPENCSVCKRWCSDEDWDLQYFWFGFDNPEWLNLDDLQCSRCIRNAIDDDYPEIKRLGLEPEIYLIRKDAEEMGINLDHKLFEMELTNAVERLHNNLLYRVEIILWLNSDFSVEEIEQWVNRFMSLDDAMKWKKHGFESDDESLEYWLEWGCSPATAAKYVRQGILEPPEIEYKNLEISLSDAIFYKSKNFSGDEYDSDKSFIGTWLPSGLPPDEIVQLRDQIVEREQVFEELHDQLLENVADRDVPYHFWEYLPIQFAELKSLGLPISVSNLESYWGLSRDEILKIIDSGETSGSAAEILRRGISEHKAGTYKKMVELGAPESLSSFLVSKGFSAKHLQQIRRFGDLTATLKRLDEMLRFYDDFSVNDAVHWLDFDGTNFKIAAWLNNDFGPHDAVQWSNEEFGPEDAALWRDSGVASPVIAKRRRDAGLKP